MCDTRAMRLIRVRAQPQVCRSVSCVCIMSNVTALLFFVSLPTNYLLVRWSSLRSAQRRQAMELRPHRLASRSVSLYFPVTRRERHWHSRQHERHFFPIAEGTAKLCGRDHEVPESTPRQCQFLRSEDLRQELEGNSEKSQPTDETQDDAETRNDFRSVVITSSSTLRAERRNSPNPTEIH